MVEHFVELRAWQEAREANRLVYRLTRDSFRGDRHLARQLRDAASSVMANIAEGFGRIQLKDRLQFFAIALGSSHETQSHLYAALDAGYISDQDLATIFELERRSQRYLGAFIQSLTERSSRSSRPG